MYIEDKSSGLDGDARIGRVFLSKTGKTLYYRGRRFQSLKGTGFKANYFDVDSGAHFWISGPRRDQKDRLYGGNRAVDIDDDVRAEYEAYVKDAYPGVYGLPPKTKSLTDSSGSEGEPAVVYPAS